ncbi:MAG: hypothetical protein LBG62_03985 [Candidatus Methanoplasma sp.]|jgi:DNA polymerase-3 subunit epsilon|nr:hypothetical protein [Candidatus Methanoplasma sp.]
MTSAGADPPVGGEIYVLDTETTGLNGAPADVVVDVGVCAVDVARGTVRDAYSSIVGYDVGEWDRGRREAWIFQNTDLTLEMVAAAPPRHRVDADLRALLRGRSLTTYNIPFDLGKFLYREPWSMRGVFEERADIMKAATEVCKLPSQYYGVRYRFPTLERAYSMAFGDGDPAGIGGKQDHRALSDARMASHLMLKMIRDGDYSP